MYFYKVQKKDFVKVLAGHGHEKNFIQNAMIGILVPNFFGHISEQTTRAEIKGCIRTS